MALMHFEKVKDKEDKKKIEELTRGYDNKEEFFVEKLAEGIGTDRRRFLSERRDCPHESISKPMNIQLLSVEKILNRKKKIR